MARQSIALGLTIAIAIAASPAAANAPDPRFAGAWRIEAAVLAPWAAPDQGFPDEVRTLLHKPVRFAPGGVSAPHPLACTRPTYATRIDAPDMLFQGGLAESGPAPGATGGTPAERARRLGVTAANIATLSVGCSEIEYHLAAPGVVLFALDNQIYTLRRMRR